MVGYAKKSTENKRLYTVRNFSVLDSVGETLHTFSAQGISFFCRPFLVGHGYAWKDSERLHLRAAVIIFRVFPCNYYKKTSKMNFTDEEFLHQKINDIKTLMWIMVLQTISQKMHAI